VAFLGAQEWSAISFPLDDLGSLELLRGPSAALYGANASSGVLNLVTKAPRASQGGLVRLTAGELSTTNADLRWAGELGSDWYFKLLGGLRNSGDFTTSRVGRAEYAVPCTATVTSGCLPQERVPPNPLDDNQIYFGGLRFDKYFSGGQTLTVEGGYARVEGPVFQTGIGRVQQTEIKRPWTRVNFGAERWNFLGYYNKRDAPFQTALASGLNLALDSDTYALELQGNWEFGGGKGRLVAGGSYKDEDIDSADPRTGRQTLVFAPVGSESEAVFAQFDWSFSDNLKAVIAGRWDDSTLHDAQVSPKASLVYSVNNNHTLRFTYNEAFQVANYSEFFLQAQVGAANLTPIELGVCRSRGLVCGLGLTPALALGNKDLELEEVKTFELGYSGILGTKAFLTVDYYNSENENFITDLLPQLGTSLGRINPNFGPWQPQTPLPDAIVQTIRNLVPTLSNNLDGSNIIAAVSYTNFGQVDTQGVDLGLNVYFTPEWRFDFSYSWFDFDIKSQDARLQNILLPNSPENKFNAGIGYVGERWDGSVSYRWVDDFLWFVGPFQGEVKSYSTVDLVANYALNDNWSIGVNIANALDDEHWESFGGDLLGRRALGNVTFKW
jgi:iron complex outermembrane receptor protein